MGNVVDLFDTPTAEGEALCRSCGHEFEAVVPAGVTYFECPECHLHKAAFKYVFGPQAGEYEFACSGCRGADFYIYKKTMESQGQIRCRMCGLEATGWFE